MICDKCGDVMRKGPMLSDDPDDPDFNQFEYICPCGRSNCEDEENE